MSLPDQRKRAARPVIAHPYVSGYDRNFADSEGQMPVQDQPAINTNQRVNALPQDLIVTPESGIIAKGNSNRAYLYFRNKSSLDIFVNFGTAAGNNIGEKISAGGFYEPAVVITNDIYVWSSGNARLYMIEGISAPSFTGSI